MLRLIGLFALTCSFVGAVFAQPQPDGSIKGQATEGAMGITETVAQIMERDRGLSPFPAKVLTTGPEHEVPGRRFLPQNPLSPEVSQWPPKAPANKDRAGGPYLPQTLGTSFLGATLPLSGAVPPDTMMAVGPSQILQCVNGRITVYSKTGAVGPLDTTTDSFFNGVRAGQGTSDPRVKFDRFTNRWIVVMINTAAANNRVLIAVSSGPVITGAASFTFFQYDFQTFGGGGAADVGMFFDYPSLGVDEDALYIGGNTFGAPQGTCFVIQKSSILGAGPIVGTAFRQVFNPGDGPYTPQGVSNDLVGTNEGYFIGPSFNSFGLLIVRRISNPGSGAPTMSANVNLVVPSTVFPQNVTTPLSGAPLDAIDDRLMEAFIRRNRYDGTVSLWTCHHIEVNASGVASGVGNRNGVRWYEIRNLAGAPLLQQSGTAFDASATPLNYWMSGINATGQGYMAMAPSAANSATRPAIYTMGRFYTDTGGQVVSPFTLVQNSAAVAYGPYSNPERWGDYATVSLDPTDDQTMWAAQQYVPSAGNWGVRIFQLKAPPPTMSTISPISIAQGATVNFVVTGNGLYDTEAGYNRLVAAFSGTGLTVNSVTLNSITQATLNVTASGGATTGLRNLTMTNPDGQAVTVNNFVTVTGLSNPVPTLSGLTPNSITVGAPGTTVLVSGSNFVSSSVVRWNGFDRVTTFLSPNNLQVQFTAADFATAGIFPISVSNPAPGGGLSNFQNFTVNNPVPTISSISPNTVSAGGGNFFLSITGTNFVPGSVGRFNGSPRVTTVLNSTSMTVTITAADIATTGLGNITVDSPGPGGGTSNSAVLNINNPSPTLGGLAPSSVTTGSGAFTLTCTGTGFNSSTVVRWNGSPRTTTFISSTQVSAAISAADVANGGSFPITVNNPAPGGGTSGAINFIVSNPVPVVTGASPNNATAGGAALNVTLMGTGFVPNSVARWNGSDRTTTFVNSTTLTVAVTAADIATAGTANLSVFNPLPGGGTSGTTTFTINNPSPTLSLISPNSATAGGAGFTITCTGTNFNSQSVVRWNGSPRTTTFVNSTTLTASISAADIATAGTFPVTIFNPSPGGGTSGAQNFTVNNPLPSIASLSPVSTLMGGSAFTLTVTGTNFNSQSVVRWNGSNRTTTFVNATTLTASILASDIVAQGFVTVTVFNPLPGGGPSNGVGFGVFAPVPILTSISPASTGVGSPNVLLTANGSNFLPNSVVKWGVTSLATTYVSSTQLTATIPAAFMTSAGVAQIRVETPAPGGGLSNLLFFTVNPRTFSGTVNLVAYSDPTGVPITLRFRPVGGVSGTEILTTTVILSPTSTFTLNTNLPPGNYDIYADGTIWLQRRLANVNATGLNITGLTWNLPAGDIDGDGAITPSDYGIWAANNGSFVTPGEFGDLDGDGAVTPSDYGIWAENNGLFDDE